MVSTLHKKLKALLGFASAVLLFTLGAGDPYAYGDRGNRYEGVQGKPVGGFPIELLGAMVVPAEPTSELPAEAAIRFFLQRSEAVHVRVRERHPKEYYWLDKVEPAEPWRAHATNVFSWPSRDVLRPLKLGPQDLLVLVRLGQETPSPREQVAPALFPGHAPPTKIETYRFSFKVNGRARLSYSFYGAQSPEPLSRGPEESYGPGRAFHINWDARDNPEGRYRLLVEGYFIDDGVGITQEVEFSHSPVWPR